MKIVDLPMKLSHELSPLPRVLTGENNIVRNVFDRSKNGAEGAKKIFGFYRLKTFFHKFSKNGIAKCAQHRFCEGARPTDEIYVTVTRDSYAPALSVIT